jgi:HEAT repeat protein
MPIRMFAFERDGAKRLEMFFRVLALSVLIGSAVEAGEIKKLSLDMVTGFDSVWPVLDSSGVAPLAIGTITSSVDRKTVVRRQSKGLFTFGVQADLGPSVDLGALLAEAMRAAVPVMGLKMQPGEGAAWKVSGTLKDAVLESKQLTSSGPLVCWGYFEVELAVQKDGDTRQLRIRCYEKYYSFRAPKLGTRLRTAAEGLVATIQMASLEILTRLNREFLKASPHPEIAGLLTDLKANGAKEKHVELRRIGLSGDPNAVPVLLDLLPTTKAAGTRALIIDALANLASPAALPLLAQRYARENGDGRFYTLKAFDYIGGEEAMALVKKLGLTDSSGSCKNLAERITR